MRKRFTKKNLRRTNLVGWINGWYNYHFARFAWCDGSYFRFYSSVEEIIEALEATFRDNVVMYFIQGAVFKGPESLLSERCGSIQKETVIIDEFYQPRREGSEVGWRFPRLNLNKVLILNTSVSYYLIVKIEFRLCHTIIPYFGSQGGWVGKRWSRIGKGNHTWLMTYHSP